MISRQTTQSQNALKAIYQGEKKGKKRKKGKNG